MLFFGTANLGRDFCEWEAETNDPVTFRHVLYAGAPHTPGSPGVYSDLLVPVREAFTGLRLSLALMDDPTGQPTGTF